LPDERSRLVRCQRRHVAELLARFCDDPSSRDCGGLVQGDTGHADTRNSIYDGLNLLTAYLLPDLPEHHGHPAMLRRLRLHLDFIRRRQRPDGSIDMGINGVGMAPEIGFTLAGACAVFEAARDSDLPGAGDIADTLEQYIRRGAEAVRRYFPLTSNHRWAAHAGPLAIVHRLFPHPDNPAIIEDILADGADVDETGLYLHERSPVYDSVANWGLMFLADAWGRDDLLEGVRRNLRFTLAMMQPSGEAETLFSHRQERGERGRLGGDYVIARRMSTETGDGTFAWLAEQRLRRMECGHMHSPFVPLPLLLRDGRLSLTPIKPVEPPTSHALFSEAGQIWRRREGDVAATIVADPGGHWFDLTQGDWGGRVRSDSILSFHHGLAVIDAIKIRWGSGTGGFRPERIERIDADTLRLTYVDPGWDHLPHFRRPERQGRRHVITDQQGELTVQWREGALRLRLRVGGWDEMPVNLQLLVREGCHLIAPGQATRELKEGGRTFWPGGDGTITDPSGRWGIAVRGLPGSVHHMLMPDSRTITGQAERRCHRLVLAAFTPVDLEFSLAPLTMPDAQPADLAAPFIKA